jgi:hypothetical protein
MFLAVAGPNQKTPPGIETLEAEAAIDACGEVNSAAAARVSPPG